MIPDIFREGVDDVRLYDLKRAKALRCAEWPPVSSADVNQFKEAYADLQEGYNFTNPEANPVQRALVFWSDSLYTGDELRTIVPDIISSYASFDGVDTVKTLTELYPDALFLPGREISVVIYAVSQFRSALRTPTTSERATLKVSECSFYEDGRRVLHETATLRLWWDVL